MTSTNRSPSTCLPGLRCTTRAIAVVAILFSQFACADAVGPGDDLGSAQDQIFFVSDRDGGTDGAIRDIWSMNLDGSGARNLTETPAAVYRELSLSPDGTELLFESDRNGCYNLFVMSLDGGATTQLTGEPGERCNEMPRWSPDGAMVAFTTSRELEPIERSWEAYVMNADGTGAHNVSDNAGATENAWDFAHTWSPDGRVVFHHFGSGTDYTYLVHADGSGREPWLTDEEGFAPYWSPDGSRVAFMSLKEGNSEIYVMTSNGSGVTNLSSNPAADSFDPGYRGNSFANPWSPDGSRLAFVSQRDENPEIYVINADGSGLVNITDSPAEDRFDGWSPDGTRILFSSDRAGSWDVYTIGRDGADLQRLTHDSSDEWGAIWVPKE